MAGHHDREGIAGERHAYVARRSGKRTAAMPRSLHTIAQRPIGVAKSAKPCSAMAYFRLKKRSRIGCPRRLPRVSNLVADLSTKPDGAASRSVSFIKTEFMCSA